MINKKLKNKNGDIINPITHESAVLDDNGVNIGEKLNNMVAEVAEVEADLEGLHAKDDELSTQLTDIEDKLFFYIDNYEYLVEDESWSPALQHIVDTAGRGATIIFSNRTYEFNTTVTTSLPMCLKGQGAANTICNCSIDTSLIQFIGTQDSYISLGSTGVRDMTINGVQDSIEPLIKFKHVGIGACYNLVLNRCGGGAITFESSQDITMMNIYTRYCGNIDENIAAVNFLQAEGAGSTLNCNEIKFVNSTFEHCSGRLIFSNYAYHNSITFISCKFEYSPDDYSTYPAPIYISGGDRFIFDDCRYTLYPNVGCFELIGLQSSQINGICYNNQDVTYFASVTSCLDVDINVFGRKTGVLNRDEASRLIYSNLKNREIINHNLLDLANEYEFINFEKIHYKDEGATYSNGSVTGGGLGKKIINVRLSDNKLHTGMTVFIKASSTESCQYNVYVFNDLGQRYSTAIHVYDYVNTSHVSIPFEFCREANNIRLAITASNDTCQLTVDEICYVLKCYSLNTTPTMAGQKGDIVWNLFGTAGDYVGWYCNLTGANGSAGWRPFGLIE